MEEILMKKRIIPIMIFVISLLTSNVTAGLYNYSFVDATGNMAVTTNSGGSLDFSLKMTVWMNDDNTLRAKIEKNDGTFLTNGFVYLQIDTNADQESSRLSCAGETDYRIINQYSKTLTTIDSLNLVGSSWPESRIAIYGRYVNSQGYVWVGPIIIERTPNENFGSLEVNLSPDDVIEQGAQWRVELPDDLGWSNWYSSGENLFGLSEGHTRIQFKSISNQWITPDIRNVEIKRGNQTIVHAHYISRISSIHGIIYPDEVVSEGARWRAKFTEINKWSDYYPGNTTKEGFTPGETIVQFEKVSGWITPEDQTVAVLSDHATIVTATYCREVPYAPSNFSASRGVFSDRVKLSWSPVSCVHKYEIYRSISDTPPETPLADNISGTEFDDFTAASEREYYYWVRARSDSVGEFSTAAIGYKQLLAPENVNAGDGLHIDRVRITWENVSGASAYMIFRNTEDNPFSAICINDNHLDTWFDDQDAIPQKNYYYWIKAKNEVMASQFSDSDSGYKKLGIPQNINASDCLFTDRVVISWDPVPGAIGYEVDFDVSRRRSARTNDSTSTAETVYYHYAKTPLKTYYYSVRAFNQHGYGTWSGSDAGCRQMEKPRAHASNRTYSEKIRTSWIPVFGADKYRIYRSTENDINSKVLVGNAIGTYLDNPVQESGFFYYWVEAHNDYGSQISDAVRGSIGGDGCVFALNQNTENFDYHGGQGSIMVQTTDECQWTVETHVDWIQLQSDAHMTGNQTINYAVSTNNTNELRSAEIYIAGEAFRVQQTGLDVVNISIMKEGNGRVKINNTWQSLPYTFQSVIGERVYVEAAADENWNFDYYSYDSEIKENENFSFETSKDAILTVNFKQKLYELRISRIGSGQVFIDSEEVWSKQYPEGTIVHLEAHPQNRFTAWSGDIQSERASVNVMIDQDKDITAYFTGWQASFTCEGLNLGGFYTSDVVIGVSSEPIATASAPRPPRYSSYMSVKPVPEWETNLQKSIQIDERTEPYLWVLAIDPQGNMSKTDEESATLRWDPEQFHIQGQYSLLEGYDLNADIAIADMREVTEYVITGGNTDQYFTVVWTPENSEPPVDDSAFNMFLELQGEDMGGMNVFNAEIGIAEIEKIVSAAPLPPQYSCRMAIIPVPDWISSLAKEIRKPESYSIWVLSIDPVGNMRAPNAEGTAVLTWQISTESDTSLFQIREGHDGKGDIIVNDMTIIDELSIQGDEIKYFTIERTNTDPKTEFLLELTEGWNLLSLPLQVADDRLKALVPDALIAYRFHMGGYKVAETLQPGEGVWVQVPSDKSYKIYGKPYSGEITQKTEGWHLMGCPYKSISPPDPERQIEVIYEFIDGAYDDVFECHPGKGFWIKLHESTDLDLRISE